MIRFKISFPTGYYIDNFENDNIDMHVILDDGNVYVATAFTMINIKLLMGQDHYFWASDMFIVPDLRIPTLKKAINEAINDHYFEFIFKKIGSIQDVYECDHYDAIEEL